MTAKNVLVAPLNWGLGHATRVVPIIRDLLEKEVDVSIASDGLALDFLKQQFPGLRAIELPSYNIRYHRHSMLISIASQLPGIFRAIKMEHRAMRDLQRIGEFDLIISDNRYGVWHPDAHSVLVSHQLRIHGIHPIADMVAGKAIRRWTKPFDELWIPDEAGSHRLTYHLNCVKDDRLRFLGPLSRFKPCSENEYRYIGLVVLSGPEPARTRFEERIIHEIRESVHQWCVVRGTRKERPGDWPNIDTFDVADTETLQALMCTSAVVICRSGYSSIMDLRTMNKRAILVPTPGQPEQLYLANRLRSNDQFIIQQEEELDLIRVKEGTISEW